MLYDYPSVPHTRIHGPDGYTNYTSYKDWLRDEFEFRCVYCLNREKFRLNDAVRTEFRRWLIALHRSSAEKPDGDTARLMHELNGFPFDLPDLSKLRPPANSKSDGIAHSHFERKKRGELNDEY